MPSDDRIEMMDDPHEEGPVCDFCELAVEPGESLEPVYVGELPQPKPHYLKATANRGGYNASREAGKLRVLRKALHDCPDVDLNESDVVHEVDEVGDFTPVTENELMNVPNPTDFTTKRRRDKVGVNIRIRPKDVTYVPDAEVCDNCAEMFRALGE